MSNSSLICSKILQPIYSEENKSPFEHGALESLNEPLNQLALKHHKKADTLPLFIMVVNHPLFEDRSLLTESFLFVHEKEIYHPELTKKILNCMRSCVKQLKESEEEQKNREVGIFDKLTSGKKNYYHKSKVRLNTLIQKHIKCQIKSVVRKTDSQFLDTFSSHLSLESLASLNNFLEKRQTLLPVLDVLSHKDPTLLTQKDFLNQLNTFLEVYTSEESSEPYGHNACLQKLAVGLQGFKEEDLTILYKNYCELFNPHRPHKKLFKPTEIVLHSAILEPLVEYEETITRYGTPSFEIWGNYLFQTSVFKELEVNEKKELLYMVLKTYSPTHFEDNAQKPILLNTCCDLYEKSPELLEYQSFAIILRLLRRHPLQIKPHLMAQIKKIISLIPDLPSCSEKEQVSAVLYSKRHLEETSLYNTLMPVFEAVMVKAMLQNKTASNSIEPKKTPKI